MDKKQHKKETKPKKRILVIATIGVLTIFTTIGVIRMKQTGEVEPDVAEVVEGSGENNGSDIAFDELDEIEMENIEKDEREALPDSEAGILLTDTFNLASNDKWDEVSEKLARYDEEFNLETTTKGKYLQDLMWDADLLMRLKQDGEDYERIMENIPKLVQLNTPEVFVYALYSLPRRYILELSQDSLALAPSYRGELLLKERVYIPTADEEGNRNNEVDKYELIKSHINNLSLGDYDTAYYKYDISHNGVSEKVYIGKDYMDEWRLIGIYSQDEYYQNLSESVSHFLEFSKDVNKGVDKLLELEEKKRQEELDEFERERELLNDIE